jgi:hypothetical protein
MTAPIRRVDPGAALRGVARRGRQAVALRNLDLSLFAVLLVLTAAFGRPFAKLGSSSHVYVTELFVVAIVGATVGRVGVRGALRRLRFALPIVLLLAYWAAGAIAALRGLNGFGFGAVQHDIGLVEYSVFLPLTAFVADTARRAVQLTRVLWLAGAAAVVTFGIVVFFFPFGTLGGEHNPGSAVGIYVALVAVPIFVRLIGGRAAGALAAAGAAFAVFLMLLTDSRTVVLALALSLALVFVLESQRSLRGVALAAVAVVAASVSYELLKADIAQPPPAPQTAVSIVAAPRRALASSVAKQQQQSGNDANISWRLAYWKELVRRTEHEPLLGVGFGTPARFVWRGIVYDARTGSPGDEWDVTPPHNSFINVLYRMGLVGIIPLLALVVVAAIRARRRWPVDAERRRDLIGIVACFVFAAVVASFNVALEGPYMSMFFWTLLGLIFVLPARLEGRTA